MAFLCLNLLKQEPNKWLLIEAIFYFIHSLEVLFAAVKWDEFEAKM